jgi:hypothetical protein
MAAALVSRAFALAMHERAAWRYDDSRTEHWHHVLGLLPRNHAASAGRHVAGHRRRNRSHERGVEAAKCTSTR